jgi:Circadian oscillating protein COP23
MSPNTFKFPVKSLIVVLGAAFMLGQNSLMTAAQTPSDVVVDTDSGSSTGSSTGSNSGSNPIYDRNTRFACQSNSGQYTVMYFPESQPNKSFAWATPSQLGGGWNPQKRCNEIARRLEQYRPDGLIELTTDVENGYNTVCVTTEKVPSCRIVLTVPPGQDPLTTRDRVFENLTVADSGQQTQGVYTYTEGRGNSQVDQLINKGRSVLGGANNSQPSKAINLRPFLDRADGGTGAMLNNGVTVNNQRQLNPGSFR